MSRKIKKGGLVSALFLYKKNEKALERVAFSRQLV